jgi:hypothetical protein
MEVGQGQNWVYSAIEKKNRAVVLVIVRCSLVKEHIASLFFLYRNERATER